MASIVGAELDFLIVCLLFILMCLFINFDLFQRERLRGRQGEPILLWEMFFVFFPNSYLDTSVLSE